ncbi:hypothetical protein DPMN_135225 [Dreissena polymorpha]|uniref:Uncharacterized protein n=1 Tax=Dreissena polymorpha TaxID=45954 RepID=A0A9D4G3I2_DREPO|nr:hypothetical protein DPMN_135225 [Dreissena polymorpha]
MDKRRSQKLTMSTLCSGELKKRSVGKKIAENESVLEGSQLPIEERGITEKKDKESDKKQEVIKRVLMITNKRRMLKIT